METDKRKDVFEKEVEKDGAEEEILYASPLDPRHKTGGRLAA